MGIEDFLKRRKESIEAQIEESQNAFKIIRILAKSGSDVTEKEEDLRQAIEELEKMRDAIDEELG